MKIKRRKEAAEWMKKKCLDEKMYKQKARKVKRKAAKRSNGWVTASSNGEIPEIQENELPMQVLQRLDLISIKDNPPPPHASTNE